MPSQEVTEAQLKALLGAYGFEDPGALQHALVSGSALPALLVGTSLPAVLDVFLEEAQLPELLRHCQAGWSAQFSLPVLPATLDLVLFAEGLDRSVRVRCGDAPALLAAETLWADPHLNGRRVVWSCDDALADLALHRARPRPALDASSEELLSVAGHLSEAEQDGFLVAPDGALLEALVQARVEPSAWNAAAPSALSFDGKVWRYEASCALM